MVLKSECRQASMQSNTYLGLTQEVQGIKKAYDVLVQKSTMGDWGVQQFLQSKTNKFKSKEMKNCFKKGKEQSLDLSEYVLKQHSPLFKPQPYELRSVQKNLNNQDKNGTPQIQPIDHDVRNIQLTPFLNGIIQYAEGHLLQDFYLDEYEPEANYEHAKNKRSNERTAYRHRSNSFNILNFDEELEGIIEEEFDEFDSDQHYSENSMDEGFIYEQFSENQNGESKEIAFNRSETQMSQYKEIIRKYSNNPRKQLMSQLKSVSSSTQEKYLDEEEKMKQIYHILQNYLVEYQVFCFDESWKELQVSFSDKIETISQGVKQTFQKKIGSLTFQSRRIKLLKYLEKKKMRRWRKKVSYDCRKKVADSRLRIKGKFVTREQVCEQLGITQIDMYSAEEIKEMLEKHLEDKG